MRRYEFAVTLNNGCLCGGTYTVRAKNKKEATKLIIQQVNTKLSSVLPELKIKVDVVLANKLPFVV